MIKGLYETHLPVSNLQRSIEFYQKLGLELAFQYAKTAFVWIVPQVSWLGLWEHDHVHLDYHPSTRHFAFEVAYNDIKQARDWLMERGIELRADSGFEPIEPFVRPDQGNASLYFNDPDGNSLEFICQIDVPEHLRGCPKMYLSEFERRCAQGNGAV